MHGIVLSPLAGTSICYLKLLDKLQKWIYRTVNPSLAVSLEPLAQCQNVASLSLFYRYYCGRCSSEFAQLVPLPYSRERSTRYSDRLHDFSGTIPRCCKDAYVSSCFPRSAILWNSLSIECFPLTYDLNGFKGCVCYILLVCFLCLKESTCETRKNVFYFTSEPLFILEITKF